MKRWVWLQPAVVLAMHEDQLAEHGGGTGLRDASLLESALARPRNASSSGKPDAAELAASYGYGLSRNHPFIDGNRRTAFVAIGLFLTLNGYELVASDVDCVLTMLSVAAGDLTEQQLAHWIRQHALKI